MFLSTFSSIWGPVILSIVQAENLVLEKVKATAESLDESIQRLRAEMDLGACGACGAWGRAMPSCDFANQKAFGRNVEDFVSDLTGIGDEKGVRDLQSKSIKGHKTL